jgi:antitoxin MazE
MSPCFCACRRVLRLRILASFGNGWNALFPSRLAVLTLLLHGDAMLTSIRRMGNSQGVLIPKPLLQQLGLAGRVEMRVVGDALVLRAPRAAPRAEWAEAAKAVAAAGDDALVLPAFANAEDASLRW